MCSRVYQCKDQKRVIDALTAEGADLLCRRAGLCYGRQGVAQS
jgi:hypothetical protein